MKLGLLLITGLLHFNALGWAASYTAAASRDMAKVEFEGYLQRRLNESLTPLIQSHRFILNVGVVLRPLPPPEQASAVPFPPARAAKEDEGLMPLTKLGLWEVRTDEISGPATPKEPEFFSQIARVSVSLILDDSVMPEQEDAVKKLVQNVTASMGLSNINFSLQRLPIVRMALAADRAQSEEEKKLKEDEIKKIREEERAREDAREASRMQPPKTPYEWAREFKIPLGLLAGSVVIFLFGLLFIWQYERIENRKLRLAEEHASREDMELRNAMATDAEGETQKTGATPSDESSLAELGPVQMPGGKSAFESFRDYTKRDPDGATLLVKQWIRARADGAKEALGILPVVLNAEDLAPILDQLDDSDRKEWSQMMFRGGGEKAKEKAEAFIISEIFRNVLLPPPAVDSEVKDLLAGLTPSEGAECLRVDPKLGAFFVQVLPGIHVARIFSQVAYEDVEGISRLILKGVAKDLAHLAGEFKRVVSSIRADRRATLTPFLEKMPILVKEVGAEKEGALFRALSQGGDTRLLEDLAYRHFPAEAISRLPSQILKAAMDRLSLMDRARLIQGQAEKDKAIFINSVGSPKMREIMESEIQQIEMDIASNPKAAQDIFKEIWNRYIHIVRETITAEPNLRQAVIAAFKSWATGGAVGTPASEGEAKHAA